MKKTLSLCLLSATVLLGCAANPPSSGAVAVANQPVVDPAVAASAKAFGQCKTEAATKNLPLAAHQDALFDCARRHAGAVGESCLGQLILNKTRVNELENELARCMQLAPKS